MLSKQYATHFLHYYGTDSGIESRQATLKDVRAVSYGHDLWRVDACGGIDSRPREKGKLHASYSGSVPLVAEGFGKCSGSEDQS